MRIMRSRVYAREGISFLVVNNDFYLTIADNQILFARNITCYNGPVHKGTAKGKEVGGMAKRRPNPYANQPRSVYHMPSVGPSLIHGARHKSMREQQEHRGLDELLVKMEENQENWEKACAILEAYTGVPASSLTPQQFRGQMEWLAETWEKLNKRGLA